MNFKDVFNIVEIKKELSISEMLKEINADCIYDNSLTYNKEAWSIKIQDTFMIYLQENLQEIRENYLLLHELGHYYCHSICNNARCEENAANLFACLYLLNNRIWSADYFQNFLKNHGVDRNIAEKVNDQIYRYKLNVQNEIGWKVLELQNNYI